MPGSIENIDAIVNKERGFMRTNGRFLLLTLSSDAYLSLIYHLCSEVLKMSGRDRLTHL
jgi:hypothetical protein